MSPRDARVDMYFTLTCFLWSRLALTLFSLWPRDVFFWACQVRRDVVAHTSSQMQSYLTTLIDDCYRSQQCFQRWGLRATGAHSPRHFRRPASWRLAPMPGGSLHSCASWHSSVPCKCCGWLRAGFAEPSSPLPAWRAGSRRGSTGSAQPPTTSSPTRPRTSRGTGTSGTWTTIAPGWPT